MKLFIACSKHFYDRIPSIQRKLEEGHELTMPNSYDEPFREEIIRKQGLEAHIKWKREMMRKDKENIQPNDAILVLNFEKNKHPNYIGGATFLEMHIAFLMGKLIYLYNPIPDLNYADEIIGMNPIILNGDLTMIK